MGILIALLWALVYIAVVVAIGWVVLWVINTYFPQIAPPATIIVRLIIGIFCLIIIIQVLSSAIGGGHVVLPHLYNDR